MRKKRSSLLALLLLSLLFLAGANTAQNLSNTTIANLSNQSSALLNITGDPAAGNQEQNLLLDNPGNPEDGQKDNTSILLEALDEGVYTPSVISNWTVPSRIYYTGVYGTLFYISANVSDFDENINSVNFSLIAPDGTAVYHSVNASNYSGDIWNSTTFRINQYGLWQYNITVWDNDFANNQSYGAIPIMEITLNTNKTLVDISSPLNVYGRIINSTRQGASNISYEIYLDSMLMLQNYTDSSGYYNKTFNVISSTGLHNLWINASYNDEYSEKNMTLEIQDIPDINYYSVYPPQLYYDTKSAIYFRIIANATDAGLSEVNFTVVSPDGQYRLRNEEAAVFAGDLYNSSDVLLDRYGRWTYTITAWDSSSYNETITGHIDIINITQQLNSSISEANSTLRITGKALWQDAPAQSKEIRLYANSTLLEILNSAAWEHDWWNSSWKYRKLVTITENQNKDIINYSVNMTIDTETLISESKMQPGCSDIRFADTTSNKLDYYVDRGCNSNATVVWVKANLTAGSEKEIYMYYGNPSAANTSNATNTFLFFDDFEDYSANDPEELGRWHEVSGTEFYIHDDAGNYVLRDATGASADHAIRTNFTGSNYSFRASVKTISNNLDTRTGMAAYFKDIENYYGFLIQNNTNNITLVVNRTGELTETLDFNNSVFLEDSEWHVMEWRNYEGSISALADYQKHLTGPSADFNNGSAAFISYDDTLYWDKVIIRKFVLNEPTSSIGPEEPIAGTDTSGSYELIARTPSSYGVYNIIVNISYENKYGRQSNNLRVMPYPAINSQTSAPQRLFFTGLFGTRFYISANATDADSNIVSLNYTLKAPNSTNVIDNINATRYGEIWNTSSFELDQYGQWNYTIAAYDSYNGSSIIDGYIRFLQIVQAMNSSVAEANSSIRITGYVYDPDGSPASNNSIYFYLNDQPMNMTDGWNFNSPAYWWNISWEHRLGLDLKVNESVSLENFLVKANFSTAEQVAASQLNPDCSDLRFADTSGQEIPFTVEQSTCNSSSTIAWLWLDMLPNTNATAYAYHGNSEASAIRHQNPDDSLRLLMHFDNSSLYSESDANIYDFSGSNHNGTPYFAALAEDCMFGSCYDFDADTERIEVQDSLSLTFANGYQDYPFTITSWIYMDDATDFVLLFKASATNRYAEYGVFTNSSDHLYFELYDNYRDRKSYIATNTTVTAFEGQWVFVAATYNGAEGCNGSLLYINSEPQNTTKLTLTEYVAMHNEDASLQIGYDPYLGNSARGRIDELRIYNRTLSQEELNAVYNKTLTYLIQNSSFTQTDTDGYFNYTFAAPENYAKYDIKINATRESVYGMSNRTLIVAQQANADPEIHSLSFNSQSPNISTSLQCLATVYDAETSLLNVEYWWYNQTSGSDFYSGGNTTAQNSTQTVISTLGSSITSLGETWNCTIRANDAVKYSGNSSVSAAIRNIIPSVTSLALVPGQPNTTSELNCTANIHDEHNTTIEVSYSWFNLTPTGYEQIYSGITYLQNSTTSVVSSLNAANTTTGETWNCTISAFDGLNTTINYSIATIVNTPPRFNLSALDAYYNDTAYLPCQVYGYDAENSTLLAQHSWYNLTPSGYELVFSGSSQIANSSYVNISYLSPGNTTAGETWNCSVYVTDGFNSTSLQSAAAAITSAPNITFLEANHNEDFDLECNATISEDINTSLYVEYSWYNLTPSGYELVYYSNTTSAAGSETLIATLDDSLTTDDETWNCTLRAYDGFSYSAYRSDSQIVDKSLPFIAINYPLNSIHQNTSAISLNFTLNESNINATWYTHDYNDTKITLPYTAENGTNLHTIGFRYPGKHIVTIYVNDTFGNLASDSETIYLSRELNTTRWGAEFLVMNPNATSIEFFNNTEKLQGNISLQQNITLEINMTDIPVHIYNFSAIEAVWEYFFKVHDNSSYVTADIDTSYGKHAVDYIYFRNYSKFYPGSDYYGKIVMPKNISRYSHVYYCSADDLSDCQAASECAADYTASAADPCYVEKVNSTLVYVPHFSAVVGVNDSIAPTITITNPSNNSVVPDSYQQYISFTVNEEATCTYSFDETLFQLLGTGTSFTKYFNYTQNHAKNLTLLCTDQSTNNVFSQIFYTVNDVYYPDMSSYTESEDEDSITISFDTDEPANCSIRLLGKENRTSSSFTLSREYTFSNLTPETTYSFNITVCDRLENCYNVLQQATTDEEYVFTPNSGSGTGSSGTGSSTVSYVFNTVFFSLAEGENIINIASANIAITKLLFNLEQDINGTILFTIERKDLPSYIPELDNVYQYLSISKTLITDEDITDARIQFRVENDWLNSNSIDRDTVTLYRYDSGWESLHTQKTSEDSTYSYYESDTPGFSYFAINGEELEISEAEEEQPIEEEPDELTGNVIDDAGGGDDEEPAVIPEASRERNTTLIWVILLSVIIIGLGAGYFFFTSKKEQALVNKDAAASAPSSKGIAAGTGVFAQQIPNTEAGDVEELKGYIMQCRSQGIEENSIRNALVQHGWESMIVDDLMSREHMPPEDVQMIANYIVSMRQKNFSDSEIRASLEKAGWQSFAIQEAFQQVDAGNTFL